MNPTCCPLFDVALARAASKQARLTGLEQARSVSFATGKVSERVIYCLPKAPRGDRTELANVRWVDVRFCPFCGAEAKPC